MPDYFIIYGEDYIQITSAVEQVNSLQNKDALLQLFNLETVRSLCIILSLFVRSSELLTYSI